MPLDPRVANRANCAVVRQSQRSYFKRSRPIDISDTVSIIRPGDGMGNKKAGLHVVY